ncbi:helix-hairpin-helix domain-containing protein [Actinomadura madurae]|uniref:helix-hairpin-helix domain-containing protein n=1 Tax=Actinomadura madurae TaxID=1993 RepID=UPI0020D23C9E|nr:helix-hairpin-helix domain-containing protein [Actinomadura madurae]MCP9977162.1 helix-hairpin-helix domain-containing protein [Actinomadura madurae]
MGEAIAKKVLDYTATGTIRQVEELRTQIPAGVRALTAIPTLGPKKALAVYEELGISSVDELGAAIKEGGSGASRASAPRPRRTSCAASS